MLPERAQAGSSERSAPLCLVRRLRAAFGEERTAMKEEGKLYVEILILHRFGTWLQFIKDCGERGGCGKIYSPDMLLWESELMRSLRRVDTE